VSKPRYIWWEYVKKFIRLYPERNQYLNDVQGVSITSPAYYKKLTGYSTPSVGGVSRTTESAALRPTFSPSVQREYDAVRQAIEATERYCNGQARLEIIRLVLWKQTHTIAGAALTIPVSERTAKDYHGQFIRMVAKNYGLMD
jgi:hypothetical protein